MLDLLTMWMGNHFLGNYYKQPQACVPDKAKFSKF